MTFLGKSGEKRADARVRILNVINGVLAVLTDGEVEVKFKVCIGLCVKEEAAGIYADLVHKVVESERLARALGNLDDLVASDETYHLHDEKVKLLVLKSKLRSCHGGGKADGMTMVVSSPNINYAVKAALDEFVAVIGYVNGIVGVKAIGAAQNLVLVSAEFGVFKPDSAVFFVGVTRVFEELYRFGNIAAFMQAALQKPFVKADTIALKVLFHQSNVMRQTKLYKCFTAFGTVHIEIFITVTLVDKAGKLFDIVSVVAVIGKFNRVLALNKLKIARLNGFAEQIDLIARVVNVKLAPYVISGALHNACQSIA